MQSDKDESDYDFGPCCCCGEERPDVRNIVMLDRKAPVPGTGWGCVVCGLPMDGASYVCCDRCIDENREPRWAIKGWPKDKDRIPIDELSDEPFGHDMSIHGIDDYEMAMMAEEDYVDLYD